MKNKLSIIFFFIAFSLILNSCIYFSKSLKIELFEDSKNLDLTSKANKTLRDISLINNDIVKSKGLGILSIKSKKKRYSNRFVWASKLPDKIRLELLSPMGTPTYSIAIDGEFFYVLSYIDNKFYKRNINKISLKEFIGIDISGRDLLFFLIGRVPIYKHKNTTLIKNNTLILINEDDKIIEKIYITKNNKQIKMIESFNSDGDFLYKAKFYFKKKHNKTYDIPTEIVLSNFGNKNTCEFKIKRYKPNPLVLDNSIFTLKKR